MRQVDVTRLTSTHTKKFNMQHIGPAYAKIIRLKQLANKQRRH